MWPDRDVPLGQKLFYSLVPMEQIPHILSVDHWLIGFPARPATLLLPEFVGSLFRFAANNPAFDP
jgi:hypothetical protein